LAPHGPAHGHGPQTEHQHQHQHQHQHHDSLFSSACTSRRLGIAGLRAGRQVGGVPAVPLDHAGSPVPLRPVANAPLSRIASVIMQLFDDARLITPSKSHEPRRLQSTCNTRPPISRPPSPHPPRCLCAALRVGAPFTFFNTLQSRPAVVLFLYLYAKSAIRNAQHDLEGVL
jgi:hypothetical protein